MRELDKDNLASKKQEIQSVVVKPEVQELFKSNPELANAVYEAFGLINTSEIQLDKPRFNPDNAEATSYPIKINSKYAGVISVNKDGYISSSIGMAGVELEKEFQGKGYGTKVYIALAEQLAKEGKTLKSEAFGKQDINEAANKVWESLLKKGYAIDKGSHFEIQLKNKQQAQQQYSQYLDTIFPDSKVKDIVYHGTNDKNFRPTQNKQGIHFGFKEYVKEWLYRTNAPFNQRYYAIKDELENLDEGEVSEEFDLTREELEEELEALSNRRTYYFPALLNIKNPKQTTYKAYEWENDIDSAKKNNNDGLIYDINSEVVNANYLEGQNQVVFEPEQIHILGSKQDIEGFKKFVSQPTTQSVKPGVSELFESNPKLANVVYKALGFKNNLKTSLGKELEYKDSYIPKNRLKDFKKYEVLDENSNNIGTVVIEYRGSKSVILHPKLNVTGKGYGKDLYKFISSNLNVQIEEWNEGAISNSNAAKKMWNSLEKDGVAKRIFDEEQGDNFRVLNYNNQITPQQETLEGLCDKVSFVNPRERVTYYNGLRNGAKWQAERSYSEVEVLQLLLRLQETESYDNLHDWFEQFKKKV